MTPRNFRSPLRYPGGKGRLAPWLAQVMERNDLAGGHYAEPFAGGAGAALALLASGHAGHVHINDADPALFAFWECAVYRTDELTHYLMGHTLTPDSRNEARSEISKGSDPIRTAFAVLFLNRTGYSGILKAGVGGGANGDLSFGGRYHPERLAKRIEFVGSLRDRITVTGDDAVDFLRMADERLPKKCLVYSDPPYFVKGRLLYRHFYDEPDHRQFAEAANALNLPHLISYDDAPLIRELYSSMPTSELRLTYSSHLGRPKAHEVLFQSNVEVPCSPYATRKPVPTHAP